MVSGTHSKTCHWCTHKSIAAPHITRRCWGEYRRYLPTNHPLRAASGIYGARETRPPPPNRTHADFIAHGRANEEHDAGLRRPEPKKNGYLKKDSPYKTSGIKGLSPLRFIPLFDLVWDILPDMMHIVWGCWQRHFLALMKGQRAPKRVKPRKKSNDRENAELMKRAAEARANVEDWTLSKV